MEWYIPLQPPDTGILKVILARRSIRKFKRNAVSDEDVMKMVECGQRAPSGTNAQTYSVIWVKDQQMRRRLWEACDEGELYPHISKAPIMLVVCADINRTTQIIQLRAKRATRKRIGYETRILGIINAALAAENIVIAAEALGLGSVFIGAPLANRRVIDILDIPKGVLPICLLCMGYADESPPIRPRLPIETVLFTNTYSEIESHKIDEAVNHMNKELARQGYYRNYKERDAGKLQRRPDFEWIDNVQLHLLVGRHEDQRFIKRIKEFYLA